ncbi:MAG: BrnA antitoxin family protein [Pseudomonadota bacterium]
MTARRREDRVERSSALSEGFEKLVEQYEARGEWANRAWAREMAERLREREAEAWKLDLAEARRADEAEVRRKAEAEDRRRAREAKRRAKERAAADRARRRAELPEGWAEVEARAPVTPWKARVTMRVDRDVLRWFRRLGPGYQTRMNAVLRAYWEAKRDGLV